MRPGVKLLILDIILLIVVVLLGFIVFVTPATEKIITDNFGQEGAHLLGIKTQEDYKREDEAYVDSVVITINDTTLMSSGITKDKLEDAYPAQTEEGKARGIAILMYHNVYDPMDPPPGLDDNYISTEVLEEELKYLKSEGYEFPEWKEVRKYIDGEIDLPEKSIVLTFDDGTDGFKKNGVPLLEKYDIPATAFIIASRNGKQWREFAEKHPLIDIESHSYDMHKAGGHIGHDGIMTALFPEQIVEDLKMSGEVLGNSDAFAYPFGDYDPEGKCRNAVEEAGFLVGFTTVYGKAFPEMDPYLLPRVRINGSTPFESFKTMI